jgi:anti-repressor protein
MSNLSVKEFQEVNKALVPHKTGSFINTVDARRLHRYLEVGRDFSTWIRSRISKYDFKEGVDFVIVKIDSPDLVNQRGGDRRSIEYHLSTSMAQQLAMVENNEMGRKVRLYYIDLEAKYLAQNDWKLDRNNVKVDYKEMSLALEEHRAELGKETKFFHYSNEADMINKIVLGMTSAQYKKHHSLESSDLIRDFFTPVQLKATYTLQKHNSAFIEAGFEFDKRKELLTDICNRKFSQKLIDENFRLEA